MPTEREIIEAKLRELVRAAETVAGCALEETLAPGDWADVILAALRESRKVDVETVRANMLEGMGRCGDPTCTVCAWLSKKNTEALAALSRLAGDE
jgi:hypothetical protein